MAGQPEGAAPAIIADHAFAPKDFAQPWGLCECGLSEAAHRESSVTLELADTYRCPLCVETTMIICNHRD
jgi:hypothetical protein